MSSLLDSVILYVVSLGDDPSSFFFPALWRKLPRGYFCACQPSFRMMRRLPHAIRHGNICCKKLFCRCHFARIFTCKSVGQFRAQASCRQKFCSGVSKNADFRHVDMEGQMKGDHLYEGQHPLKTMLKAAYQKIFKKVFPLCLDFYIEG